MKELYDELARLYESGDLAGASKFYYEKIVPQLNKEIKKMKKEVENIVSKGIPNNV